MEKKIKPSGYEKRESKLSEFNMNIEQWGNEPISPA